MSGGPPRFYKPAFGSGFDQVMANVPMPDLGDSHAHWTVDLNEPEINAIHAVIAFVRSACSESTMTVHKRYWEHYGPTLDGLSDWLARYSEEPEALAPHATAECPSAQLAALQSPNTSPKQTGTQGGTE